MAEMTKKLHFLKNGTEQTAKAYSTTAEAGSSYITNVIDNTTCYIPLGATGDAQATIGRVTKGGTTYAIKSQAKPAYAEKSWTTAGTYTWTAPAGVTRIRVAVCGGGGGQATVTIGHSGWYDDFNAIAPFSAGNGGTSSFGSLVSATGGTGGVVKTDMVRTNGSGGKPNGNAGTGGGYGARSNSTSVGGRGFLLSFTKTTNSSGYGTGGGCSFDTDSGNNIGANASGGSGGYNTGYFNVTSGATYTVTVGAAGRAAHKNLGSYSWIAQKNVTGRTGGFVLIAYGEGI